MEPPLSYKKMTGFATTEGQQLEVNLAALLFLRGLNSGMDFQLGTNVEGAGALDDVVFRFKPFLEDVAWTTVFVQLKHKANRPVQRAMLTSPRGDFSLPKYFESSREIKHTVNEAEKGSLLDGSFEESVFLVYTNAKASVSLGIECRDDLCPAGKFVWCEKGNVLSFEEDDTILQCLGQSGAEGIDFLKRLRLFCGQPDAKKLEAAIEIELRKVDDEIIQGVEFQTLLDCFLRHMKLWWEKSREVLYRGNDVLRASVLEAISQRTEKKYSVDIDFEEAALAGLLDSVAGVGRLVHLKSTESSCRLSVTKLSQAFGGQSLVLNCKGLLANRAALLAQWRKGGVKCLTVCTDDWNPLLQVDYFDVVKTLLVVRDTPTVFLANAESCPAKALTGELWELARSCEDDFLFSQLNAESQDKVLATEVFLQGHSTTLLEMLKYAPGGADRVLDACSVVEILERDGGLTLGSAFGEGIDFYVDRHLEQTTALKDSVFQDGSLREPVTVRVSQCESSVERVLDNDGFLQGLAANDVEAGLFDNVVNFLSSINSSKSLHGVDTAQIVSHLSKSQLVADKGNGEVFIGPVVALGWFKCWPIGLRFGQKDAVTALWVRASHSAHLGFLFFSDKTSDTDARKLSDFHQSRHWLSLKDGQLRWVRSHGDIEAIRRHVDKDQVLTFAPENATDVEDRLVLVCAEPGMGKSTLMARLARKTKEAHPLHFVFLIALNDHSQLFANGEHKDALGFLCSANKIESPLHRSLLKYALEVSGDVVVLFDGYDEIAPKYVDQSCHLLATLVDDTKARKVWMTSRNSIKATLETRISKLAVELRGFTEVDQISFLKKFWAAKAIRSEIELDVFIKQLVEKISEAVRDKEHIFLGIPLQTQMLAEVYECHLTGSAGKSKLPEKLDTLELLNRFVDEKCRVYVETKLKISPDSPNYEALFTSLRKTFMKSHARAALVLILGQDAMETLGMGSIIKKSTRFLEEIRNGSFKTGFIDSVVNGKPRFIHRVFAEYFVAKWISKNFEYHRELVASKMFTADFVMVRTFFDRMLAKGHDLHTAVLNEDLEEVRALLAREDINAKDGGARTALHLAASLGTSENREVNKRRRQILELLIGKTSDVDQVDDVLGVSPLKYADITRTWVAVDRFKPCADNKKHFTLTLDDVIRQGMLDAVFSLDLGNLLRFCLDNGLEVEHRTEGKRRLLHRACELGSLKAAAVLIERNANIYGDEDRNDFILHVAASNGHLAVVKLLHERHTEMLRDANVNELSTLQMIRLGDYVNMPDEFGRTAIHLAAQKGRSDVIGFLIGQGGDPKRSNDNNITPLHAAAGLKHSDAVRVLLEAMAEPERGSAVNSRNNFGDTVLMYAVLGGCVECVELIINAGGKLTQASDDGRTPLMTAAQKGHQAIVCQLLDSFNPERESTSLLDFINSTDNNGRTSIHFAASNGHSEVAGLLVSRGGDPRSRDHDNLTPLHLAAESKHPDAVRVLLEALDEAGRADSVNSVDNEGNSVLAFAASGGCPECVGLIVTGGGKLTQGSYDGRTALMVAAQKGRQEAVRYLTNNFDAEGTSLQDYINTTEEKGWTAIHFAALNGHSQVLSILIGHGGDPLRCDHDNLTPLHHAAGFKHPDAVRVLLEALAEAGRADAVNSLGNKGNSVLVHAAAGGCAECVRLLLEGGATQTSGASVTPLMIAAHEGHTKAASYLIESFKAEERRVYVNKVDEAGRTAMHLAAQNGRKDVIDVLIRHGGDVRSCDRDNITPLHLAVGYKHPDVVCALLQSGDCEVDAVDNDGNSMLMYGALGGCAECVGLIVKAGGKLTQVGVDGRTPLMAAAERHHVDVFELLLSGFDSEREGVPMLAYVMMTDKEGNGVLDSALAECRQMLERLIADLMPH